MSETGSVKFNYEHVPAAPVDFDGLAELNACRSRLLQLGLVGIGRDGIGFGNLSLRDPGMNGFYITGSGTGGIAYLTPQDCSKVTAYDFTRNWLRCEGGTVASAESLTHAAVYEADASAAAVIHCHSATMWERLRDVVPTTCASVEYGTPEMAHEVMRLFATTEVKKRKIFVMAGHEEGIVAFGKNCSEAFGVLISPMDASSSRRRSEPRDLADGSW